ncbi:hypothetical protein [Bacillus mycoides]|uniref:hypothetical protein n=1 Tax=Bacillus mycoides TaxID=1405 RepID=UPI0016424AC1|nr:hypothetical protein [Bacillus mycoides]
MEVQRACEVIESLLDRDIKEEFLTLQESIALNQILLEASIKLGYKVTEEKI